MVRRRLPLLLLTLVATTSWGIDQKFLDSTIPTSVTLKALGGTNVAAGGYDGLWANPASFADPKASLTLSSFEATANVPLSVVSRILANRNSWTNTNYLDANNPMVGLANDLLTKYGLGAETNWGLGWAGSNLGLALNIGGRSTLKGTSLLGAADTSDVTVQGLAGVGWPFDVGLGTLKLGLAVRPMQKYLVETNVTDAMNNSSDLSKYTVSAGFGLGWDLGALWDYAGFRTGLVIRDAGGTVFSFKDYTLAALSSNPLNPSGGSTSGTTLYRVPTVIGLGTTWTPDLGALASLVQPSVSLDLQIPLKDEYTQPSFFTWVHFGTQATFLNFLSVRAGLNQGYFTFGLGAKVLVVDLNVAVYADELGRYSGLNRRSGIATELAFRL